MVTSSPWPVRWVSTPKVGSPELISCHKPDRTYRNVGVALAAAGCGYGDLLKMNTYLVSSDLIEEFMQARAAIFPELFPSGEYPPNTLAIVSRLVEPDLLIEVEALAVVGDR